MRKSYLLRLRQVKVFLFFFSPSSGDGSKVVVCKSIQDGPLKSECSERTRKEELSNVKVSGYQSDP